MTERLSKHRYLQVTAHKPVDYEGHNIRLPDDWDLMSDTEREHYIKKACFDRWQEALGSPGDEYDTGKGIRRWWQRATADDLDGWSVEGTALEAVVTQPKALLVLNGLYARNSNAYWEEPEEN